MPCAGIPSRPIELLLFSSLGAEVRIPALSYHFAFLRLEVAKSPLQAISDTTT